MSIWKLYRLLLVALVGVFVVPLTVVAQSSSVDLDGPGWTFKTTLDEGATVSVPHCWPAEEKYRRYIGDAIYQRDFDLPALAAGKIARLHFDAVFDVATVWLNGHRLGTHEGGYTPFEFEVTHLLKPGPNHLLVEVNNTPTLTSIPAIATSQGSQHYPAYGAALGEGIVGWMPYGGIVRPVSLIVSAPVYLSKIKIDAKPDLKSGDASLTVHAWIHNASDKQAQVKLQGTAADVAMLFHAVRIAPASDAELVSTGTLPHAHLWDVHDPFLYDATVQLPEDEMRVRFGVREIRVQGTELLLNGKAVHLFGANRVSEDPAEGLLESNAVIDRDMKDMLADNMRMMRIAHYPQTPALLDFADKHGMLIIPEAGNWNMSAWQMADPLVRSTWQKQMKEMMEQDWNHPSVIAWSVGNEYESFTKDGIAWSRDMRAYTLGIDNTRLITFASRFTGDPSVKTGTDEASQYSDFVSINVYGNYAHAFDHAHELFPDKPIFVTEFGRMGEPEKHDPERIKDVTAAVEAMKARPWMIGGSLWTWADYRSLHRGTPASGIRYWGVVNLNREHRDSWQVVHDLFETTYLNEKQLNQ